MGKFLCLLALLANIAFVLVDPIGIKLTTETEKLSLTPYFYRLWSLCLFNMQTSPAQFRSLDALKSRKSNLDVSQRICCVLDQGVYTI